MEKKESKDEYDKVAILGVGGLVFAVLSFFFPHAFLHGGFAAGAIAFSIVAWKQSKRISNKFWGIVALVDLLLAVYSMLFFGDLFWFLKELFDSIIFLFRN